MPTCANDPALCETQKQVEPIPELRAYLLDSKFISDFQTCWKNSKEMEANDVEIVTEPFDCCIVKNFLQDSSFFNHIRDEFNDINWNQRNMDLYEFFQSQDLKNTDLAYIRNVYQFLKDDVMPWVSSKVITNLIFRKVAFLKIVCSFGL